MRILLSDDGIAFDGESAEAAPLGGAERAFVGLAEALAARGHDVFVRNRCAVGRTVRGVDWAPLGGALPPSIDLYIANRANQLLALAPDARRLVFWIHNPARYLLKRRYLWPLWRRRPVIVFSGRYHLSTYPAWAPDGGRVIIPYGLDEAFRDAQPAAATPPPRAIFTSNPLRSLDWLLDIWATRIQPRVPGAELQVFSSPVTYGAAGDKKAGAMTPVLARAAALADRGVVLRAPLARGALIDELRRTRLFLYRGDLNETFCYAAAEAQAMGVPAVVGDRGSLGERVADGRTGFVMRDGADDAFAAAAVRLLTDDALWRDQHRAALDTQRGLSWDAVAAQFEALAR